MRFAFGFIEIDNSNTPDTITIAIKVYLTSHLIVRMGLYFGPSDENLASASILLDQVDMTGETMVMFDEAIQMNGDDFTPDSFYWY